jgi:predicted ATPase/class 3 adenylate cyclase
MGTAMRDLPSGTVTFLFTDIEGSTRLLQAAEDEYPAILERHFALLRGAVSAGGGREVSRDGDALFAVFTSAVDAVAAVAEAQRALSGVSWAPEPVRVRMGLHTGEGVVADGTYVGLDVHRAARIGTAAHGGQILLSESTQALASGGLPDGTSIRDLGRHRLKDLAKPERLFQLVVSGLATEFPALRTLDATPNNLPTQLTTFLGRERELAEAAQQLAATRLLTLTGPGGTGKTRLSLQLAAESADEFADGVFFVPLALITEPSLVVPAILGALGLSATGGRQPTEVLVDHLATRCLLLVLDNFEQVTEAGPIVTELLSAAPRVKMVATSRSPLRVYGEREYAVPPLDLPDLSHLPTAARLSQFEAVALFIERATAVRPGFAVTNENAPAVAEICVRLDGLPLALELAAARIKLLTAQAILARLEKRLDLLSSGARDLPARQQTLRGAIAWSYDLLEEPERRLFACLGVFAGGTTLEMVDAVVGSEAGIDVLDGIASLVDKSLVRQEASDDEEPRFALLQTIREYAQERLDAEEFGERVRRRHAATFLALAEEAAPMLLTAAGRRWLDRLESEHENLRAALGWSIAVGDATIAQRLITALWRFWQMRAYLAEARKRCVEALAVPGGDADPAVRARALEATGGIAYWQADFESAAAYYEEALELDRAAGDPARTAESLYNLAMAAVIDVDQTAIARAGAQAEEALELFRSVGDQRGAARALWALGNVAHSAGEPERAIAALDEATPIFRELGDRFMLAWADFTRGAAALKIGDHEGARSRFDEALRIFRDAGDVTGYILLVEAFAWLAKGMGDHVRAVRLAGAVDDLERTSVTSMARRNRDLEGDWLDPRRLLADPALRAEYDAGQGMTADDAVAYALEPSPSPAAFDSGAAAASGASSEA